MYYRNDCFKIVVIKRNDKYFSELFIKRTVQLFAAPLLLIIIQGLKFIFSAVVGYKVVSKGDAHKQHVDPKYSGNCQVRKLWDHHHKNQADKQNGGTYLS